MPVHGILYHPPRLQHMVMTSTTEDPALSPAVASLSHIARFRTSTSPTTSSPAQTPAETCAATPSTGVASPLSTTSCAPPSALVLCQPRPHLSLPARIRPNRSLQMASSRIHHHALRRLSNVGAASPLSTTSRAPPTAVPRSCPRRVVLCQPHSRLSPPAPIPGHAAEQIPADGLIVPYTYHHAAL